MVTMISENNVFSTLKDLCEGALGAPVVADFVEENELPGLATLIRSCRVTGVTEIGFDIRPDDGLYSFSAGVLVDRHTGGVTISFVFPERALTVQCVGGPSWQKEDPVRGIETRHRLGVVDGVVGHLWSHDGYYGHEYAPPVATAGDLGDLVLDPYAVLIACEIAASFGHSWGGFYTTPRGVIAFGVIWGDDALDEHLTVQVLPSPLTQNTISRHVLAVYPDAAAMGGICGPAIDATGSIGHTTGSGRTSWDISPNGDNITLAISRGSSTGIVAGYVREFEAGPVIGIEVSLVGNTVVAKVVRPEDCTGANYFARHVGDALGITRIAAEAMAAMFGAELADPTLTGIESQLTALADDEATFEGEIEDARRREWSEELATNHGW